MTEQVPLHQTISTQDTNVRDENGAMVPGKRVNIVFADGNHAMVEVPFVPGWSELAKEAIDQLAAEHQNIMGYQGPMVQPPQRRGGIPIRPVGT